MTGHLTAVVFVGTVCLGCGDGAGDPDGAPPRDARASLDAPPPLIDAAGPPTLDAGPPDAASPLCPLPIDVPEAPLLEPGPVYDRLYWIASEYEGELTRDWGGVCPCIATQRLQPEPNPFDAAVLFSVAPSSIDVVVDMATENLLWTERDEGRIRRRNRFGAGDAITLVEGLENPHELAMDSVARRLYWTEVDTLGAWTRIRSARMDGTDIETVLTVATEPAVPPPGVIHALQINPLTDRIQWIESNPALPADRVIRSASLDGSDPMTIATPTLGAIQSFVVDPATGELYWTELPDGVISWVFMRASADGSSATEVHLDPGYCPELSWEPLLLSATGDQVVFSVRTSASAALCAAPTDGSGATLLDPSGESVGRGSGAVGASPDRSDPDIYYWSELECSEVFGEGWEGSCSALLRARRGAMGSWSTTVLLGINGIGDTDALAIDPVDEWLYWSEDHTIYRIGLDGTRANETFLEASGRVSAMEVDGAHRHLYYGVYDGQLHRADLDGAGTTLLPFGSRIFRLDPSVNRIYWLETDGAIRRARLDGTDVEDLVADSQIYSLELDLRRRTLYWFQRVDVPFEALIWRADLCDLGDREVFAFHHRWPGFDWMPWDVRLDAEGGAFYFTLLEDVRRIELDGVGDQLIQGATYGPLDIVLHRATP